MYIYWITGYYLDNSHYNRSLIDENKKRIQHNFLLLLLTMNCLHLQEIKLLRVGDTKRRNILMVLKCEEICVFFKETTKDNLSSLQHKA